MPYLSVSAVVIHYEEALYQVSKRVQESKCPRMMVVYLYLFTFTLRITTAQRGRQAISQCSPKIAETSAYSVSVARLRRCHALTAGIECFKAWV